MSHRLTTGSMAAALVACVSLGAQQADRSETEALSRRAEARLKTLHEEADKLAADARSLLNDLQRLEIDRQIRAVELTQIERDAAAAARELVALDGQIAELEQEDVANAPALRARFVSLYKLGSGRYLRMLLSASDPSRIAQASRIVTALAAQDRNRIVAHQQRMAALSTSRSALRDRQRQSSALRVTAQRAKAAADAAVQARNALITEIDGRRDLNAQLSGELIAAQQRLQATLTGMTDTTPAAAPALPIGPFRGDLDWPVAGAVRQRFGDTENSRTAATSGIDLAAAEGSAVHAVHDGVVAFADVFAGFGRLTILDHGGQAFSLYGNLGELTLKTGSRVKRGDAIGTVGVSATGATGLYFELRIDGRPVDPLQWLRKR